MKTIHLSEVERAARRSIDWNRVHVESDRRPALSFVPRPGRWLNPVRRTQTQGEAA